LPAIKLVTQTLVELCFGNVEIDMPDRRELGFDDRLCEITQPELKSHARSLQVRNLICANVLKYGAGFAVEEMASQIRKICPQLLPSSLLVVGISRDRDKQIAGCRIDWGQIQHKLLRCKVPRRPT
jgi:hypothetical protein